MYRPALALSLFAFLAVLPACQVPTSPSQAATLPAADPEIRMVEAEGEGGKYWPRWRGPSGQGVVEGSGYVDRWSSTQNVIWKVPVPGRGHSSPIVWEDRIFLTTAYDDGKRAAILCFDRNDGRKLWETAAPSAAAPERIYRKNSHASATPSTDGKRVYAYLGNQGLLAVDMAGRIVWHQSLGPMKNYHGTAGSPLLYKDRIILYQDQGSFRSAEGAFIAAYDSKTGRQLWRTEREASVGWGTPVAVRVGNRDEIIVNGQRRIYAYDPGTGKALWWVSGSTFEVIPTPVVGDGLVFCSSGRAGPTLAIRPGGKGDVSQTHLKWSVSKGSPFVPSPLVHDGILYTINDMVSVASAFRASSGELLWQGRLGEAQREGFSASPLLVDGKVFFTNDSGQTFVVKAGNEFELLHVNELAETTLASPALVDGRWYFRTEDHLVAIGG